ncbi:MAG TPA: Maf family protein [Terriglobales bacterium]|nr:Maf family protein [Terriglobales bacterium]
MLILASASPRRAELLRNAGLEFRAVPPHVPEEHAPGEAPTAYVERLARAKAEAIAARFSGDTVLGADTTVVIDAAILEKPRDAADARRMLRQLSGRTHHVTTGVCVAHGGAAMVEHETTLVTLDPITEDEIDRYVAVGEPMDKAGAYAIQGIASRWASRIEGCYFNVVGLPVPRVYRILRKIGAA